MKVSIFKLSSKGFTLIEMVITIAVAAIVIMVVVPSFSNLIESSKERAARDSLVSSIYLAKQHAQSNQTNVYLCPTDDNSTCASTWASDWLIYENFDSDTNLTTGDVILSSITTKISLIESTSNSISFTPTGHSIATTFKICSNTDNSIVYQIELSRMGRITYTDVTGSCS